MPQISTYYHYQIEEDRKRLYPKRARDAKGFPIDAAAAEAATVAEKMPYEWRDLADRSCFRFNKSRTRAMPAIRERPQLSVSPDLWIYSDFILF